MFKANKIRNSEEFSRDRKKGWKFTVVVLVLILSVGMVIYRLFSLQVIQGGEYREKARRQHESRIELLADRGAIYDRNGNLLAATVYNLSVAADPTLLKDKKLVAELLGEALDQPASRYLAKISAAKGNFVWLVRGVNPDRLWKVKKLKAKGLIVVEEPKRIYPYGATGAQVIGITDIDNNGISGIELGLDSMLKGRPGFMMMFRDGLGRLRPSPTLPLVQAIDGRAVQLTIDINLQRIVEYELLEGMKRSNAAAGTVICLQPETGEVLAIASYPLFDPENKNENFAERMRIRGITDVYEPGSTFKAVTAAAALEEGLVTEEERLNGKGGTDNGGSYVIRDVHGMGVVPFRVAMQQSSNIILGEIATRLSDDKWYSYLRKFGFGQQLGIEMPGEVRGRIVKPENFHKNTKRYQGHGYGLNTTPLQIVNAYATIANGGSRMKPYIVKKIISKTPEESKTFPPKKIGQVHSEKTSKRMQSLLVGVVDSGSGKATIIQGMKIAGKTGTSQQIVNGVYSKQDYNASFVGFFPAYNPQVAMICVVDRPRGSIYGGSNAAPVFKGIVQRWINSAGAEPEGDRSTFVHSDTGHVYAPMLAGMSIVEARRVASEYGLGVDSGSETGVIFNQFPQAGARMQKGDRLVVTLSNIDFSGRGDKKHDVSGLPSRRAVGLLQGSGIRVRLFGSGRVVRQEWNKVNGETVCYLYCQ